MRGSIRTGPTVVSNHTRLDWGRKRCDFVDNSVYGIDSHFDEADMIS
jgi:hypothetical protein